MLSYTRPECRRAKFTDVKKILLQYNVSYVMLYPAKLRVTVNDHTQFFEHPAAAFDWLDREEHTLRKPPHN